jgi:molecular chaperone DnaK
MASARQESPAHAIGIDLGTTYSCISYLTPQGTPVTIENEDGELSTPSVVLFDGEQAIVGTEALRNAVSHPERVVQNLPVHGRPAEILDRRRGDAPPAGRASLIIRKP